jgi:3-methyl-2-oxobutanoate hydroxymethyltransferase
MSRALTNTLRSASQVYRISSFGPSSPVIARTGVPLPVVQARWSSHSPLGASLASTRKPVTINTIQSLYRKNEPITVITAHDFPSAHVADHAGMDIILVGDSLAMVALGMDDTSEVLMDEMLLHCKSVARATKGAFTVWKVTIYPLISMLM